MPTVLIIIESYLPGEKAGGPVRTTSNMVEWLGDDFEFKILTTDRDIGEKSPYEGINYGQWYAVGKAEVRYLAPSEQSLVKLSRILRQIDSDLFYVDALYASLTLKTLLLRCLRLLQRKPIILVPRGQWRPEAMQIKARKKKLFMLSANLIGLYYGLAWHVSSIYEGEDVEARVGKNLADIRVIPNLPLPLSLAQNLRQPLQKESGSLRMVFLSRIVRNKGLHFILKQLSHLKGNIQLDIYGSIQDSAYWRECRKLIAELPHHISANYRGVAKFDAVAETLSQYQLFVLPTLSENFGHVIIESLISACPVMISDRTPWKHLNGAGWVLSLDEPTEWIKRLQEMIDLTETEFRSMSEAALLYGEQYRGDSSLVDDLRSFLFDQIGLQSHISVSEMSPGNIKAGM